MLNEGEEDKVVGVGRCASARYDEMGGEDEGEVKGEEEGLRLVALAVGTAAGCEEVGARGGSAVRVRTEGGDPPVLFEELALLLPILMM